MRIALFLVFVCMAYAVVDVSPRDCACVGGCPITWTSDVALFNQNVTYTMDYGVNTGKYCQYVSVYQVTCGPASYAWCDGENITLLLYTENVTIAETW